MSSNTTNAVYITEEQNGQIAANTPNGIDLDQLTEGTDYVVIDDLASFKYSLNCRYQSNDFQGHRFHGYGPGQTDHITLGHETGSFTVGGYVNAATATKIIEFGKRKNRIGVTAIYIVRQLTSTTFMQFPNATFTLKNYAPVVILEVRVGEGNSISDNQQVQIICAEVWT